MHIRSLNFLLACTATVIALSCSKKDADDIAPSDATSTEINSFVWRGMNAYYLYKDDVADLGDNRFSSENAYNTYLKTFSKPEDLFDHLIYKPEEVDRFSWIVDDYIALEQFFKGVSLSNGVDFNLYRLGESATVYGVVRLVLPGSDAASKNLKRGDIFFEVDGKPLYFNSDTDNNIALLGQDNYTLGLATYNDHGTETEADDTLESRNKDVVLTKVAYTEDPIYIHKTFPLNGKQVGYLMYNGFTGTDAFNAELNDVFGQFKNDHITELVLDLRYNGGGSIYSALILSSLITGQFTGDVFSTEQWNRGIQSVIEQNSPDLLVNLFIDHYTEGTGKNKIALNTLGIERLYVLTTGASASASELVINCLRPYISVTQIGETTAGKYQGSITLYDSDDFTKDTSVNPTHKYAIQPLVLKSLNAQGVTDYFDGLSPDILFKENPANMGVLGEASEPMLATALGLISGTNKFRPESTLAPEMIYRSEMALPFSQTMYSGKKLPKPF